MSSLQLFNYEHHEVRTVLIDGEPWFVAADVARILGYRDAANMTRRLDAEDRGTRSVSTPSGDQEMTVITEPGLYVAVLGSQVSSAKEFKRWVTRVVLPEIRKTGSFNAPAVDLTSLSGIDAILNAGKAALNRAIEAEKRAEASEAIVEIIENGEGASLREFHKQYFSDLPERQFFNLLYRKKLLIDQRDTVWDKKNKKWVNGKDHGHPTYLGKPFFFLNGSVEKATGKRRYQTKVRPGTPEVTLIAKIETFGLTSNRNKTTLNMKELF